MPTIRPVAHEARLSLVDHLDELRDRLIWCVIAYVIAFGLCFWQNNRILEWLNTPLAAAKQIDCSETDRHSDALERAGCFDQLLADALKTTAPALKSASSSLAALATGDGLDKASRTRAENASADLANAAKKLAAAAQLSPDAQTTGRTQPVTLGVTEPFLTTITVAAYTALLLALPMILYQLYAFILPAFTPHERKMALPAMLAAPLLFIAGVAFAYWLALPRALAFLQGYNDGQYDILVQARDYYRFVVLLLAALGVLFQIPLAVLAVVRLQILTPRQLRASRGYALLLFAVLAAIVTPTPDPITMLLSMAPLVILYETSIQISRFIAPNGPSRWKLAYDDEDTEADAHIDRDLSGPVATGPAPRHARGGRAEDDGDGLD